MFVEVIQKGVIIEYFEPNIGNHYLSLQIANHAPLILRLPGSTDIGLRSSKLVEFVDIFPTLVEVSNLLLIFLFTFYEKNLTYQILNLEATGFQSLDVCPEMSNSSSLCTEGSSLLPLLKDPESSEWKGSVFWQYPRFVLFVQIYSHKVIGGYFDSCQSSSASKQ